MIQTLFHAHPTGEFDFIVLKLLGKVLCPCSNTLCLKELSPNLKVCDKHYSLFKILLKNLDKKLFSICFLSKHKLPGFTFPGFGKGDKT